MSNWRWSPSNLVTPARTRPHELAGFSQEGFAAAAGLDRADYGAIERGERNVSALNLIRIALMLDCEVGELFPPIRTLVPLDDA